MIGLIGTAAGSHLITTPTLRSGGFAAALRPRRIIGVAVLEETLMAVVLVGLLVLRPQEIDGVSDGVVYGSMVGLGFALIENIYYYTQAESLRLRRRGHHVRAARACSSPLCQALFSLADRGGRGLRRRDQPGAGAAWAIGVGWAAAVALHALWNASLAVGVVRTRADLRDPDRRAHPRARSP